MSKQQARRIRMGMVGGGPGSFIGPIHRMAAELDGTIQMVAGCFSSDAVKSREAGRSYGISEERVYDDYRLMMEREHGRSDAIDFVCIVTPNHLHLPVATAAMENGVHVVSDKPATANLAEALALERVVRRTRCLYALTYTYTGYSMVREARHIIRSGSLGEVRKVVVEYLQGWLSEPLEKTGHKQAAWRVDPQQAGIGGAIGDIGVHALNLLEYVIGCRVVELCASLSSLVPGRQLDDDCNVLIKLDNGASGVLVASQIAAGERNNLQLHVYGTKGGIHWSQENPNRLEINWLKHPSQILYAARSYLTNSADLPFRVTLGLPEGMIEAFANIYRDFALAVYARSIDPSASLGDTVPGIEDGVRSLAFVDRAVNSSRAGGGWVPLTNAVAD
jgi:predicted dehydrogenase